MTTTITPAEDDDVSEPYHHIGVVHMSNTATIMILAVRTARKEQLIIGIIKGRSVDVG